MPIPLAALLAMGVVRGLNNVQQMKRQADMPPQRQQPPAAAGQGGGDQFQQMLMKVLLDKITGPQAQPMQSGQLPFAMNLFSKFPTLGG